MFILSHYSTTVSCYQVQTLYVVMLLLLVFYDCDCVQLGGGREGEGGREKGGGREGEREGKDGRKRRERERKREEMIKSS